MQYSKIALSQIGCQHAIDRKVVFVYSPYVSVSQPHPTIRPSKGVQIPGSVIFWWNPES